MNTYRIFLSFLVLGIICLWSGTVFSHKGEGHKSQREPAEPKVEHEIVAPSLHQVHEQHQMVERDSLYLIDGDKKSGYRIAVVFTVFVGIACGVVSFYWREDKR